MSRRAFSASCSAASARCFAASAAKSPKEGEILCLTPIPFPADGAKVNIGTLDGQRVTKPDALAGKKKPEDKKTASTMPEAKPLP
jgi:hypothetical protein